MEENKAIETEEAVENQTEEQLSAKEKLQKQLEEIKKKSAEANEALGAGKGILTLETPITAGGRELTELPYDFTELTTLDIIESMDSDGNANNIFKITYRQGISLFAAAASKKGTGVDSRDILERMGATDGFIAAQLGMLFYNASIRAGRMRISKM